MKIVIDIETIKGVFSYRGPIRIKFKLGDAFSIWTEFSQCTEGVYPFLQKHLISLNESFAHSYVQISIVAQNGNLIAQRMVFFDKFKQFKVIQIKYEQEVYKIAYSIREIAETSDEISVIPRRASKKIQEEPPNMNEQSNKLEIFRLGILMYNFAQRLDPLVYVYDKIISFLMWKNPLNTVFIGFLISILVLYAKTSILIGGICLYFGKDRIFKKLSTIHRYKDAHKRIIVPKQNAYFLQNSMDHYCQLYESITAFLFNDDKTLLINLIKFICKTCAILILLFFFFSLESIIIITLWTVLIFTSPLSNNAKRIIKPTLTFLMGEYQKIFDKISLGISNIIGNPTNKEQLEVSKVFYYYHYERWWVLKGWLDQNKKYSDQKYEAILFPRQRAPEGWAWTEQWKIDWQGEVDSSGYQYSNDLMTEFKATSGLMTRRRRKWKRTCFKLHDGA